MTDKPKNVRTGGGAGRRERFTTATAAGIEPPKHSDVSRKSQEGLQIPCPSHNACLKGPQKSRPLFSAEPLISLEEKGKTLKETKEISDSSSNRSKEIQENKGILRRIRADMADADAHSPGNIFVGPVNKDQRLTL